MRSGILSRLAWPFVWPSLVLLIFPLINIKAEEGTAGLERPKYNVLRYKEDWSGLAGKDLSATGDILDPLKYVELDSSGFAWLSLGGQVRTRIESWRHFGFGKADDRDDTFWLARLRFHGDLHFGEHVRIFAEGKSALATDRDLPGGRRTLDLDELDLQNGFADISTGDALG